MTPMLTRSDEPRPRLLDLALRTVATEPVRRTIEHYFAGLGGTAVTPRRAIDPARLRDILPSVILIEAQGEAFPVRLAGTGFSERLRREITGTDWLDIVPEEHRAAMAVCLRRLLAHPCGVHFLVAEGWRTEPCLEYALLPISKSGQGTPDMLFGAAAMIREPESPALLAKLPAVTSRQARLIDIGWGVPEMACG